MNEPFLQKIKAIKWTEWLKIFLLSSTILTGFLIGLFDLLGKPLIGADKIPALLFLLVGAIASDLVLELYNSLRSLDDRFKLYDKIGEIPKKDRKSFIEGIENYIKLHELRSRVKDDAKSKNTAFADIAAGILFEQRTMLENLAKGVVWSPDYQIARSQRRLTEKYQESMFAVTDKDLSFWIDPKMSEEYFATNRDLIREGSKVTRIFVLSISDLVQRRDDVVKVLTHQHINGVGWGVIVREEIAHLIENQARLDISPDFALFNNDRVITFFRNNNGRKFEAVFHLGSIDQGNNSILIENQMKFHQTLINECWMVNSKFYEIHNQLNIEKRTRKLSIMADKFSDEEFSKKHFPEGDQFESKESKEKLYFSITNDESEICKNIEELIFLTENWRK